MIFLNKNYVYLSLMLAIICNLSTLLFGQLMRDAAVDCAGHRQPVVLPIHVNVLFAGTIPLFMRNSSWRTAGELAFLSQLNSTVRHRSLHFEQDSLLDSPLFRNSQPQQHPCSVIEYSYTYTVEIITDSVTLSSLDTVVSSALNTSSSIFIDSANIADAFSKVLSDRHYIKPFTKQDESNYFFLVYNTVSVAPQYAYRVEASSPVSTIGLATSSRFAFLDVGARPFLLETFSQSFMPGEILASASRSLVDYANTLKSIVTEVLTPPVSANMHHFPHQARIAFHLNLIDVSTAILRNSQHSNAQVKISSTFNTSQFITVLRSAFHHVVNRQNFLTLSLKTTNITEDAPMALAIARAISYGKVDIVLDKDQVFNDVILPRIDHSPEFDDSSFVVHVPLYLFSFLDEGRSAHFESSEAARTAVVDKQALLIIENRIQEATEDVSLTSDVASHILELLCGLGKLASVHIHSSGAIPVTIRDHIRRNLLVRKVDWSEKTAASKAQQLLNFEGLDSRFIPHEQGSSIEMSRNQVRNKLRYLYYVWRHSVSSSLSDRVDLATVELARACDLLASKLHAEICNQRLPEEILLKAEAEAEGEEDVKSTSSRSPFLTLLLWPAIVGALLTLAVHRATMPAKTLLSAADGIASNSTFISEASSTTTHWFSTLHSSRDADKRKVN